MLLLPRPLVRPSTFPRGEAGFAKKQRLYSRGDGSVRTSEVSKSGNASGLLSRLLSSQGSSGKKAHNVDEELGRRRAGADLTGVQLYSDTFLGTRRSPKHAQASSGDEGIPAGVKIPTISLPTGSKCQAGIRSSTSSSSTSSAIPEPRRLDDLELMAARGSTRNERVSCPAVAASPASTSSAHRSAIAASGVTGRKGVEAAAAAAPATSAAAVAAAAAYPTRTIGGGRGGGGAVVDIVDVSLSDDEDEGDISGGGNTAALADAFGGDDCVDVSCVAGVHADVAADVVEESVPILAGGRTSFRASGCAGEKDTDSGGGGRASGGHKTTVRAPDGIRVGSPCGGRADDGIRVTAGSAPGPSSIHVQFPSIYRSLSRARGGSGDGAVDWSDKGLPPWLQRELDEGTVKRTGELLVLTPL